MKILVVYYSLGGNTALIARAIAAAVGGDLLALRPKEEISSRGFMKYFWGGRQVVMRTEPPLLAWDKEPQAYDLLFIGTPVWAWRYAAPLASFFSEAKLKGKKAAVFCCHQGGKAHTLVKMRERLHGNEILGEADFVEPLRNAQDEAVKRAQEWAKEVAGRGF